MKVNPAGLKKFNEEQARLQSLVDADPIMSIKGERALSAETSVGGVLFTSLKASILIDAGSCDKDKQAIQEFDRAQFPSRYSEVAQNPRRDPRDLVPRQWQTALRVVASWHGLSQQSPRGATGPVAETCAACALASWC